MCKIIVKTVVLVKNLTLDFVLYEILEQYKYIRCC